VSFTRTPIWPRALQKVLEDDEVLRRSSPVLCIATWLALEPDPLVPYWIYTDRPARERASGDRRFAPRSRRGWLEREAAFLRGARRIYLTGEYSTRTLIDEYEIPPDRIVVVGAAPNTALAPAEPRAVCRRLLFVGVDWKRKGGPDLLAAFAAARADYPELALEIVGCDPPGPLPDGTTVSGSVPHADMAAVFARSDVLVLPSYFEATPFVIYEALLQGIPVVSTNVANIPTMVGDSGMCVSPGRADELARAIRQVVAGYPAYRANAAHRGRTLAASQNWNAIAARMLETMDYPLASASAHS
jgi:glycosyltransferase involved in cell wall biosynthesis